MYTLLIIDDEKDVREAISALIDWERLGIRLIGTAGNGIEALNMILDEYPDIVMTDIKMPGLSGIDLIGKIKGINQDTEVIILTGFGEFEYAKQAMQFGVRHYLLKPCDEKQIIDSICQIKSSILKRETTIKKQRREILDRMKGSMINSFFRDGLSGDLMDQGNLLFERYRGFFDIDQEAYTLIYIFYLEQENLERFLGKLKESFPSAKKDEIYVLYVKNTLLMFGKTGEMASLAEGIKPCRIPGNRVDIEMKQEYFNSLYEMLLLVLKKIRRYEYVYFGQNFEVKRMDNQAGIYLQLENLMKEICGRGREDEESRKLFYAILNNLSDREFLYKVAANLLVNRAIMDNGYSMAKMYETISVLRGEQDLEKMKTFFISELDRSLLAARRVQKENGISGQIEQYVSQHLQDTTMSLKWIAENILYMNVDYVSRRFLKETGKKFSAFLAEKRIEKAKELLMLKGDQITLTEVAEQIGCGNNPQYFGQLFKKMEGISPSAFREQCKDQRGQIRSERPNSLNP